MRARKRAQSGSGASTGISWENSELANLTPFKPGVSGSIWPEGLGAMPASGGC